MASSPPARRLTEIDSLRGLAALWVVVFHFSFGVGLFWLPDNPAQAARVAPFSFNLQGLLAVDMFFMISGFVIFMTLERAGSVMDFAVSRFSRLFPAYWVCLLLSTAVIVLIPVAVQSITMPQVAAGVTMFNLFIGFKPIESVYWSLAVELAFYIIMASLFWAGWLNRIERLGGVWLAISVVAFTIFPNLGAMLPWRFQTATILPYTPLFFAGILLYRIRTEGWTRTRIILLAACFLARISSAYREPSILFGTLLIFALFVPAALGWNMPFLRWRPLVFLGGISYPLYLVHQSIGFRIQEAAVIRLGAGAPAGFAITVGAVILLSWLVSIVVEKPAQNRIRIYYKAFVARRVTA